jgi:hypothetical protein
LRGLGKLKPLAVNAQYESNGAALSQRNINRRDIDHHNVGNAIKIEYISRSMAVR